MFKILQALFPSLLDTVISNARQLAFNKPWSVATSLIIKVRLVSFSIYFYCTSPVWHLFDFVRINNSRVFTCMF